jgi:thiol-disulfide isomerase/thioredoxin
LPDSKKIVIEVMYKASYCLPCLYMDETVREILPEYEEYVEYRRIDFMKSPGRERFLEISCELFGKEAVYKKGRLAPVPSLFMDGELFFDAIPPMFELREAIEEVLVKKGLKKGEVSS